MKSFIAVHQKTEMFVYIKTAIYY